MENEEIKGQSSDEPTIQELKNASIIFAQALTSILKDKEGIVVDIDIRYRMKDRDDRNLSHDDQRKEIIQFYGKQERLLSDPDCEGL